MRLNTPAIVAAVIMLATACTNPPTKAPPPQAAPCPPSPARGLPKHIYGAGAFSCGKFLRAAQEDSYAHIVNMSWVTGFISAQPDVRASDFEGIEAFIIKACEADPTESLVSVSMRLQVELMPKSFQEFLNMRSK